MTKRIKLYDSVKIKDGGSTGVVVDIYTDGSANFPVYFVEKDDECKVGVPEKDLVWCKSDEIELI